MAKPFYSIEEVCKLLSKNPDQVKQLVRDGSLREFRDAGKVFFKADDVDKLTGGAKNDTGEIVLEAADDELPSLSGTGGTSMIGLAPSDDDERGKNKKKKEGTVISASGIGVFDDDEIEIDSDPMAKTTITSGVGDQASLEGAGSGSGLLDLTRESDDTSLGAELLDEIYPGEEDAAPAPKAKPSKAAVKAAPPPAADEEEEAEEAPAAEVVLAPRVAAGDASEGMLSGLTVGSMIVLAVAASVVAGGLQGFMPSYALFLSNKFLWFAIGAAVLPLLCLGIGALVGKASAPRR